MIINSKKQISVIITEGGGIPAVGNNCSRYHKYQLDLNKDEYEDAITVLFPF